MMMLSMSSSSMFILMKHPLSMGFMLLIQTTLTCMMNGMMNFSYWFSYIMFITFIGGMMILFIYIASIASNEKFKLSMKIIIIMMIMIMMLIIMKNQMSTEQLNEMNMFNIQSKLMNKEMITINKMFNYPNMMVSMMTIIYLLFTLIAIIKINNIKEGPLRMKN
uniref:NADH-ubiquinone oxidoreductase chain 6 n=1 Tax=Mahanarva spectabilis TaxID=1985197 RepID=A0A343YVK1_9HEMI|nr:NADH dehydrogenase subunit 6 [Mahanarva spectabilis]